MSSRAFRVGQRLGLVAFVILMLLAVGTTQAKADVVLVNTKTATCNPSAASQLASQISEWLRKLGAFVPPSIALLPATAGDRCTTNAVQCQKPPVFAQYGCHIKARAVASDAVGIYYPSDFYAQARVLIEYQPPLSPGAWRPMPTNQVVGNDFCRQMYACTATQETWAGPYGNGPINPFNLYRATCYSHATQRVACDIVAETTYDTNNNGG